MLPNLELFKTYNLNTRLTKYVPKLFNNCFVFQYLIYVFLAALVDSLTIFNKLFNKLGQSFGKLWLSKHSQADEVNFLSLSFKFSYNWMQIGREINYSGLVAGIRLAGW